jgi:mannose-1-phosphate guanylyltransferase/phosphomannomutase
MVPLLGKPCMAYILELLKRHGIEEIAVTLQYLPEQIQEYFGDGTQYGVKLYYFVENEPLGTAGSVKNAEAFLDGSTFLVISGDALTDFDLKAALDYHEQKQALVTIVATTVDNPSEYGVIETDQTGRIVRFQEKPRPGEAFSRLVNTGIYLIEPSILSDLEKGKPFDFSKNLFPQLLSQGAPLYAYEAQGYWSDIGTIEMYRKAQFDILDGKVNVEVPGVAISPWVRIGKNVTIKAGVEIRGSVYIGDHSILEKGVRLEGYTVIGEHTTIQPRVTIRDAVVWEYNYIDQECALYGASLGRQVILGKGVTIREGAVVGDYCALGRRIMIEPGVKVFPNKMILHNRPPIVHKRHERVHPI